MTADLKLRVRPIDSSSILIDLDKIIIAKEKNLKSIDPDIWDDFVAKSNGSARVAFRRILNLKFRNIGRYKIRIFEVYQSEATGMAKIGQCVLAARQRGRCLFIDRLQLLPAFEHEWTSAMKAVLSASGAHDYEYGWQLNFEAPREGNLNAIEGVTLETVRPLVVQAVDFQKWTSWEQYYRALSENSRRNAKAAERQWPNIRLLQRSGRRSLLSLPALVQLRAAMAERKSLNLKVAMSTLAYLGWIAACPKHVVTNLAVNGRQVLATYFGIEFGDNTYYLEGASRAGNGGAAWYLLLAMLRRAYERHPKGKFIMGYTDKATLQDEGLLRSRAACRVTDYPTSVVRFRYDPA